MATSRSALATAPAPANLAIFAAGSVAIDQGAQVTGPIAALGATDVLRDDVALAVDPYASLGDAYATSAIFNYRTALTDAYVGTAVLDLHASGSVHAGSPPSFPAFPHARAVSGGAGATLVAGGSTVTASGATLGRVSVAAGGVLELPAGSYQATDLELGNAATLRALGPVELRVAERFKTGARARVQSTGALRIEVLGSNGGARPSARPFAVELGDASSVRAVVFAPNGTLRAAGSATGALVAQHVWIGAGAHVTYEGGLQPLPGSTPLAGADTFSATRDRALTVAAPGVLGNDVDPLEESLGATLLQHAQSGTVTLSADGGFTFVPNTGFVGATSFTYGATHGARSSAPATVTILVDATNEAPRISSVAPATAFVGEAWRYAVSASDPDAGDTLTYSLSGAPSGVTIHATSGLVSWTPSAGQVGTRGFTVVVTDGGGLSASQAVRVDVFAVPQLDAFTLYADNSLRFEGLAVEGDVGVRALGSGNFLDQNYRASIHPTGIHDRLFGDTTRVRAGAVVHDVYSNTLTMDGTQLGGTAPLPAMPALPGLSAVTPGATPLMVPGHATQTLAPTQSVRELTISADACLVLTGGTYSIASLTMASRSCLVAQQPATVRVSGRVDIGNWTHVGSAQGTSGTIRFEILGTNGSNNAASAAPPAFAAGKEASLFATILAPNGTAYLDRGTVLWGQVIAKNVSTDAGTREYRARSPSTNRPPVFVSAPVTSGTAGAAYTYTLQASDPDAGDSVVRYELVSGPAGMSLTGNVLSWASPTAGTYSVVVRAYDRSGEYGTQTFTLTITRTNVAPAFTSTPVTAGTVGASYAYTAVATDADGDSVSYGVVSGPAGLSVGPSSGIVSWLPTAAGDYPVVLRATDPFGLDAVQGYTIAVVQPNRPPSLTSSPQLIAFVDAEYSYSAAATDPDGDALSFTLITAPPGMTVSASGLVVWTPSTAGPASVLLRVSDGHGGTADQSFVITVVQPNRAPVFTSTPVTDGSVGSAYTYDAGASDADGDALSFALITAPAGMSLVASTGLISWTPSSPGSYDVLLRVSDGHGGTADQAYSIAVVQPNRAPVFTSTPVPAGTQGTLYTYDADATDADGDTLSFALLTAPAGMSIVSGTGVITWTPSAATIETIAVRVSDGHGGTADQTYTLSISSENHAPYFDLTPSASAVAGTPYVSSTHASDPDAGDSITYSLDSAPAGLTIDSGGHLTWTPSQAGDATLVVRATDDHGAYATQTTIITVAAANAAPVFSSTPATTGAEGAAWSYALSATDADGDTITFSLVAGPAGMTLSGSTLSWASPVAGTFNVSLRATDPSGAYATQTFVLVISPRRPPVFTSTPPASTTENELYTYFPTVTDPDGDAVTLSLSSGPSGLVLISAVHVVAWVPDDTQIGTYSVQLRATDSTGLYATQSFTITVSNLNDAPRITSAPSLHVVEGEHYFYEATAVDPDPGELLTYSLVSAPAGMSIDAATGVVSWYPTNAAVGFQTAHVRVTDLLGAHDAQTWTLLVSDSNEPPVIVSAPVTESTQDISYGYRVLAEDPDPFDAASFTLLASPVGMSIDAHDGRIFWATPTPGLHPVSVRVTDIGGLIDTQTFVLTIFATNHPPTFVTTPLGLATSNYLYEYLAQAMDPDGDPLRYDLIAGPAGASIDASAGLLRWTPTRVGSYEVSIRATEPSGGSATQSFTVIVSAASGGSAPVARFAPSRGNLVTLPGDGARVLAISAGTFEAARSVLIPGNFTGGYPGELSSAPLSLRVGFIADRLEVVDRAVVAGNVGELELWVATDSSSVAPMTRIFAGTHDPAQPELTFPPVAARQVELRVLSPASNPFVTAFEVRNRPREGALVSLLEGGAQVVETDALAWSADEALRYGCDAARVGLTSLPSTYEIELSPHRSVRIDQLELVGSSAIRDFELRTSTASPNLADLQPTFAGRYEELGSELMPQSRRFVLEGIAARFVDLRVLSADPGALGLPCVRLYSPDLGGPDVAFDDESVGEGLSYHWSFGDGATSSEQHPAHHFAAAGEYLVELTVTDALGRSDTTSMRYTAFRRPAATFTISPTPLPQRTTPIFTSAPTTFDSSPLRYGWRRVPGDAYFSFGTSDVYDLGEWRAGDRMQHQLVDTHVLRSSVVERTVPFENIAPSVTATLSRDVYWGEIVRVKSSFGEIVGAGETSYCVWSYGDGTPDEAGVCNDFVNIVIPNGGDSYTDADRTMHRYDAPGTYLARFIVQDALYGTQASYGAVIEAHRRPTSLAVAGTSTSGIDVVLVDGFDGRGRRAGLPITAQVGPAIFVATTDAEGVAHLAMPPPTSLVELSFAGNSDYLASEDRWDPSAAPLVAAASAVEGREFVLGFPWFTSEAAFNGEPLNWLTAEQVFEFHFTSRSNGVVRIANEALGVAHVAVRAGAVSTLTLPGDYLIDQLYRHELVPPNVVPDWVPAIAQAKFRVTSSVPFSVAQLWGERYELDGALALPVSGLGEEYLVASAPAFSIIGTPHRGFNSRYAMLAAQADAIVSVTPRPGNLGFLPGQTFALGGETGEMFDYYGRSELDGASFGGVFRWGDATGTHIHSTAPLTVYGAHGCALSPLTDFACNALLEQMTPTRTYGKRFHTGAFGGRRSGGIARVVALTDGTTVTLDGTLVATLAAQETWEHRFAQEETLQIETSAPALAVQLAMGVTAEPDFDEMVSVGDPAMMLLVPDEQWASRYTIQTFDGFRSLVPFRAPVRFESWTTLVVPTARVVGMVLDQHPVLALWTPIGDGTMSMAHVPLSAGAHNLYHADPTVRFAAYVYGWDHFDAYAYPAGMQLASQYGACAPSAGAPGDGVDNDCDGRVDEEAADATDDDGDVAIDEDLAPGAMPTGHAPVAYDQRREVERDTPSGGILLAAFDADGDILSYEVTSAPAHGTLAKFEGSQALLPSAALTDLSSVGPLVRYVPAAGYVGMDSFRFRVSDGSQTSSVAVVHLDVSPRNHSPIVRTTPPTTAWDGVTYDYLAEATDEDPGAVLTWSLVSGPAGMTVGASSGQVSWTPEDADVGQYHEVTLMVTDELGGRARQSFVITVVDTPEPPVVTSTPALVAFVGGYYSYAVQVADPDPYEQHDFEGELPVGATLEPVTGLLEWRPQAADVGLQSFAVTVRDRHGLEARQPWSLLVRPVNSAPVFITSPVVTAVVFGAYAYTAQAVDADASYGDTLSYAKVSGPTGLTVSSAGLVSWTPAPADLGSHEVVLRATDSAGATTDQRYWLLVSSSNHPPRFVSSPVTFGAVGQSYTHTIVVQDPDVGDVPSLALVAGPSGMVLVGDTLHWTPGVVDIGGHQVIVRATDREGESATQAFGVDIEEHNASPQITSTPVLLATQGQTYRYQLAVTDANVRDGKIFSVIAGPAGLSVGAGGLVTWTPSASQVAVFGVTVQVADFGGGIDTQSWTIEVIDVNDPPMFVSTPVLTAVEGSPYSYTAVAADPDAGDVVRYGLREGPRGMSLSPASGLITWTSSTSQVGSHLVRVEAIDGHGATASQSYTLVVSNVNDAPVWVSRPETTALAGARSYYRLFAMDPDDGDSVHYALVSGPGGLSLTGNLLSWVAPASGAFGVVLDAIDAHGASARQSYTLVVTEDHVGPRVTISLEPPSIAAGGSSVLTATWSDNATVAAVVATFDGAPVALDGGGRATLSSGVPGVHTVEVTVTDGSGNATTRLAHLGVTDPSDTESPVVQMGSPVDDEIVLMQRIVTGTVSDDNLLGWTLSLRSNDGLEERTISSGVSSVISAPLGVVDATLLENAWYSLILEATDVNGVTSTAIVPIEVQGRAKVGVVQLSFIDLAVPVQGIPVTVSRSYDSRVKSKGDFGVGWKMEMTSGRFSHNRTPGLGWSIHENFPPPSFPCSVTDETSTHRTTVRLSDREWYRFRPRLVNVASSFGSCFADVVYEYEDGSSAGATLDVLSNTSVVHLSGTDEVNDEVSGLPWEPEEVLLTTFDGRKLTLVRGAGVTRIEDLYGNSLDFGPSGVVHSSGRSLTFARDAENRIASIEDPFGETIEYGYDAAGDLVSVKDPAGFVTRFTYDDDHNLVDIINPLGNRAARNEYDAAGRQIAVYDALGRRIELEHDLANRVETTRDRLGHVTVAYYDVDGNITRKIDAAGEEWLWSYDSRGNELTSTDPLGRTTTKTYDDKNNLLSSTDVEGDTVVLTYNAKGKVLTTQDARGRLVTNTYAEDKYLATTTDGEGATTSFVFSTRGELLSTTDALNRTTTYTYSFEGNQLSREDALGHVTTMVYDAANRKTSESRTRTLPNGSTETLTTTFAFDANGKPTTTTDALGHASTVEWDGLGKPSLSIAKNGLATSFVSNSLGLLSRIEHQDGTADLTGYDAEGRVISETDRLGHVTTHEYDALGRRTKTTHPDGSYTQTAYDVIGRVLTQRDERGNITTMAYGVHTTTITNALGEVSSKRENSDGNVVRETDALGHSTLYTYDLGSAGQHGQGRLIRVDFADGTHTTMGYDAAGQKIAETDELGRTTSFAYDALGRLTSVTNTAGAVTSYGYDEVGNRTSIVDANGHVTRFEYDALGRMTARVLPEGQRETMVFDAMGRMTSKTDMNGEVSVFGFDLQGRMDFRRYGSAAPDGFTYDALGRRLTAGAESFSYDARSRLLTNTKATGEVLTYTYDSVGNRTGVSGPHGSTAYTFDPLNRLATVSHGGAQVMGYGYDVAGREVTRSHGNGLTTTQSFDARNRLIGIETRTGASALVSSYGYMRDDSGRITAALELPANRSMSYGYDAALRLASEAIVDPANGNRTIGYSYDAVGNRLYRADSASGMSSYQYDANDRLLTETSSAGLTSYAYDENGSVIEKSSPNGTVTYSYDSRNLMTSATVGGVVHGYSYDVDGARVSKSIDGVLSERFLIDANMPHAQVLRETNGVGAEVARHVYGVDEVAYSVTPSGGRFMHYDGQRSVRELSSAAGAVVHRYGFDAFGRPLASSGATQNAYGYSGERADSETGLVYLRARLYEPNLGRLHALDPHLGSARAPRTQHGYAYAGNDPILRRDPTGKDYIVGLTVGIGIVSVLSAVPHNTYEVAVGARGDIGSFRHKLAVGWGATRALALLEGANIGNSYEHIFEAGNERSAARMRKISDRFATIVTRFRNSANRYRDGSSEMCARTLLVDGVVRPVGGYTHGDAQDPANDIMVCSAAYGQEPSATDSLAWLLIHETAHLAGARDHAYGVKAMEKLSEDSPDLAVENADHYSLATFAAHELVQTWIDPFVIRGN